MKILLRQMRAVRAGRFSATSRRAFHVLIALILLACAVSPFVESAVHCHGNIFTTGHDTESAIAVLVLLLELAISLASVLVFLCANLQLKGLLETEHLRLTSDLGFDFVIPEGSPPIPLRI